MVRKNIRLNNIQDIKRFVAAGSRQPFDIDILSGRFAIDGKSIMGIFSLDLSKVLTMQMHVDTEEQCADFLKELDGMLV